ncbi:hypothetical protein MRX96_021302 [Rhipicephalus microplus]
MLASNHEIDVAFGLRHSQLCAEKQRSRPTTALRCLAWLRDLPNAMPTVHTNTNFPGLKGNGTHPLR